MEMEINYQDLNQNQIRSGSFNMTSLYCTLARINKAHGLSHYLKMAYLNYLISLWWSDLIRVLATENKF